MHFSYYFVVVFFHYLALHFFSLAASAPHTSITSSGDNFKYREPKLDFFYLFLLLIFMIIKVINNDELISQKQ